MRMPAQASPQPGARKLAVLLARPRNGCRQAAYQDVLDAPEDKVAEVMRGRLYLMPRPALPHATAGARLLIGVGAPFDTGRGGPGGWRILYEPEVHFGDAPGESILVPDLAGWRRERMPAPPKAAFVTVTPDWVCEVLSPSTHRRDLGVKRDIYARAGIPHLWLVDPSAKSLETFALEKGEWRPLAQLAGAAEVRQPPFEAISFPLADLWR